MTKLSSQSAIEKQNKTHYAHLCGELVLLLFVSTLI